MSPDFHRISNSASDFVPEWDFIQSTAHSSSMASSPITCVSMRPGNSLSSLGRCIRIREE